MCDTVVALGNCTKSEKVLFAKNSDRSPNEPHLIVRYPARDYDITKQPDLKATYISLPQVEHTHEVVLLKPDWIWGAEMGFNEFGVNIGNEAVFTRERKGEASLIGMDLLRLALERAKTAKEAVNVIIDLLGKYGQGGNCGYDHTFHYHNSFLIADGSEAYVLETAGQYYAGKKVEDYYAISNCLSIENDYDFIHEGAIAQAIAKKRCASEKDFGFARCFTEPVFTHFAKARNRRCISMDILQNENGAISEETMMRILRSHADNKKEEGSSVGSVCMHAGGLVGDHTTGSYIAEIGEEGQYLLTGTSLPCLSIFKPYYTDMADFLPDDEDKAKQYWLKFETLHRYILAGQIDREAYLAERDALEAKYLLNVFANSDKAKRAKAAKKMWAEADRLADKYLAPLKSKPIKFKKGGLFYRNYWSKKTKILLEKNNITL